MSSNPIRLQVLLQKYISNSASAEELKEFWKLMSELSENDLVELDLENLWNDRQEYSAAAEVDWEKAAKILHHKIEEGELKYERRVTFAKRKQYLYAAAAVLLLTGTIALLWKLSAPELAKAPESKMAVISKSAGHQVISLPDGTIVTLNEGSKLNYPVVFNQASRDVYLTGEAYFDVKHDAAKPFLVHTGTYITRVLGTAFNIRAYPGDADLSVTVTRGKVQVQSDKNSIALGVLTAGDQLVIDKASAKVHLRKTDVAKVLEWKATDLVFDNTTVDEALISLGNRYGKTFVFENESIRTCRFTANFINDSLNQSLDVICTLINAQWEPGKRPDIIILKGKGCN